MRSSVFGATSKNATGLKVALMATLTSAGFFDHVRLVSSAKAIRLAVLKKYVRFVDARPILRFEWIRGTLPTATYRIQRNRRYTHRRRLPWRKQRRMSDTPTERPTVAAVIRAVATRTNLVSRPRYSTVLDEVAGRKHRLGRQRSTVQGERRRRQDACRWNRRCSGWRRRMRSCNRCLRRLGRFSSECLPLTDP